MARPHIHYEAAFEDFLNRRQWPYVPTDEHRRAVFAGSGVKGFDFLVYPPGGMNWMVEVKGRKFPYEIGDGKRYWENWVTQDDLKGLDRWTDAFGEGFQAVFVFAYWLLDTDVRGLTCPVHEFRDEPYAFLAIPATVYAQHARRRSPKWDTVTISQATFRRIVQPIDQFVDAPSDSTLQSPALLCC